MSEAERFQSLADVGSLVRRIRAERGLTQEALARELGVSFATVNGWENGRHHPIPSLARRLSHLAIEKSEPGGSDAMEPPEPSLHLFAEERGGSSGWPADSGRERRDFFHRPREFPADVARWRAELVERALVDTQSFPRAVRAGHESMAGASKADAQHAATERVRGLVDEVIAYLREVARILAVLHGTPRLGNKSDPVDELVYIILSRKTREEAYQQAFDALKHAFLAGMSSFASRSPRSRGCCPRVVSARRRRPASSGRSEPSPSVSAPARSSRCGPGVTPSSRPSSALFPSFIGRVRTAS